MHTRKWKLALASAAGAIALTFLPFTVSASRSNDGIDWSVQGSEACADGTCCAEYGSICDGHINRRSCTPGGDG